MAQWEHPIAQKKYTIISGVALAPDLIISRDTACSPYLASAIGLGLVTGSARTEKLADISTIISAITR
jgi:hypothetical protein